MDFTVTIEPMPGVDIWKGPGERPAGSAKGAPVAFAAGKEAIVFGRDATASDVVFGAEHLAVGRKHCQLLRQTSGDYKIEVFGKRAVEIDGAPASNGDPVHSGAKIRLGGAQGPTVTARIEGAAGAVAFDPNKTLAQPEFTTSGRAIKRMRRIQAAVAVALVVVVAGVAAYFVRNEQNLDVLNQISERVKSEIVDPAAIAALESSAFAVIQKQRDGRETLQGTAWPVAPGVLATNAHVANLFKGNGGELIVRRANAEAGGDGDFKVIDATVHDGYALFSKFDANAKNVSSSYAALSRDTRRTGYDVALLTVADGDRLPLPLPWAPEDEILHLRPGMAVVTAGYPIRGTADQGSAQLKPTPTVQYGRITAVTDFFMFGTEPEHAFLIQHSLPATGGASGSAIVDAQGRVVAILSGGHVVDTADGGSTSNAVMRNFAQRVDLLAPLLDDQASFDLVDEQARWNASVERFNNHRNSIIEDTKAQLEAAAGGSGVVDVVTFDGSLTAPGVEDNGYQRYVDYEVPVEKAGEYAFLVYGSEDSPLSLIVYRDGEDPAADGGAGFFARVSTPAKDTGDIRVRVMGLSKNPSAKYTLYVYRADGAATAAAQ